MAYEGENKSLNSLFFIVSGLLRWNTVFLRNDEDFFTPHPPFQGDLSHKEEREVVHAHKKSFLSVFAITMLLPRHPWAFLPFRHPLA